MKKLIVPLVAVLLIAGWVGAQTFAFDNISVVTINGSAIANYFTSTFFPDLFQGPDIVPTSPTVYDDEFNGSALGVAWSLYNSTGLTATVAQSQVGMTVPSQSGYQLRGFFETAPAATFEFTAKIHWNFLTVSSAWGHFGLTLRESATDKLTIIGVGTSSSGGAEGATWSSATSGPSGNAYAPIGLIGTIYVKVLDNGTNIVMSASPTGTTGTWSIIKTVAVATAFTTAPNQVGFTLNDAGNDSAVRYYSVEWVRRTQ